MRRNESYLAALNGNYQSCSIDLAGTGGSKYWKFVCIVGVRDYDALIYMCKDASRLCNNSVVFSLYLNASFG